jgi:2-keto-4-pentenoate hydratase
MLAKFSVIASASEAIQNPAAAAVWIASALRAQQ